VHHFPAGFRRIELLNHNGWQVVRWVKKSGRDVFSHSENGKLGNHFEYHDEMLLNRLCREFV
jgi:hypothetical protein